MFLMGKGLKQYVFMCVLVPLSLSLSLLYGRALGTEIGVGEGTPDSTLSLNLIPSPLYLYVQGTLGCMHGMFGANIPHPQKHLAAFKKSELTQPSRPGVQKCGLAAEFSLGMQKFLNSIPGSIPDSGSS